MDRDLWMTRFQHLNDHYHIPHYVRNLVVALRGYVDSFWSHLDDRKILNCVIAVVRRTGLYTNHRLTDKRDFFLEKVLLLNKHGRDRDPSPARLRCDPKTGRFVKRVSTARRELDCQIGGKRTIFPTTNPPCPCRASN